ncbi:S-adenosyl-L-methionine-dependent methyltransferases superfamily protein [Prunus dulcis]|uniref:RNA methyltransferase n=1 Tax=Prunus dulcis TaxID=3755 RepID=A0A4Y1RWN8_PRUDU|nr:S-adenosyl-L-methionine-dependent methyltransferases superfamily protein [Prunus dulcis]
MCSKQKEKKGGEEREQQHVQNKSKKRKEICPYGNYKHYYGYRIGQELEEDPRLKVFKKEWFQGKDCLDIGCNSGIMTIQIAKKFCCQSILGVDIDANRIQDAYWHIRKFLKMEDARKVPGKSSKLEDANGSESSIKGSLKEERKEIPRNCCAEEKICLTYLSVTKWIHLNWGDDGLIALFTKVWRLLNPGGIFVLEPQPWKSYENNYKVSETTRTNYKNLKFHPEYFQDLLLDRIGFKTVENVTSSVSGSKTGFNRPILVFRK